MDARDVSRVRCNSNGPDKSCSRLGGLLGIHRCASRLRDLAQSIPGLGRKDPELKRFLATTELAERCRHYIQHLRQELADIEDHADPVWGSLSWEDPADQ